jgi:hypothetical protein
MRAKNVFKNVSMTGNSVCKISTFNNKTVNITTVWFAWSMIVALLREPPTAIKPVHNPVLHPQRNAAMQNFGIAIKAVVVVLPSKRCVLAVVTKPSFNFFLRPPERCFFQRSHIFFNRSHVFFLTLYPAASVLTMSSPQRQGYNPPREF